VHKGEDAVAITSRPGRASAQNSRLFGSYEQAELVGGDCGHADDVRGEEMGVSLTPCLTP
jgi:hypothetical protein